MYTAFKYNYLINLKINMFLFVCFIKLKVNKNIK